MADCETLAKQSGIWKGRKRHVFGTHGKTPCTATTYVLRNGRLVEKKTPR